jgi:hypothetical protein
VIGDLAQRFIALYAQLDNNSMEGLDAVYTEDVVFVDPFRRSNGLLALQRYLRALYENVESVRFVCEQPALCAAEAYIRWNMFVIHPRLNSGREIVVPGISFIRGEAKVFYHQDFYDAGALIYEQLPLLGSGIRLVKRRMHGADEFI